MSKCNYDSDMKADLLFANFVKNYGFEGYSKNFEGCKDNQGNVCTGHYFSENRVIMFQYIDNKGRIFNSEIMPIRFLETNIITKQKIGI